MNSESYSTVQKFGVDKIYFFLFLNYFLMFTNAALIKKIVKQ